MSNLSRRSLVSSAAALPALAVPAVAIAVTAEPDPIFAAIEEYKRTKEPVERDGASDAEVNAAVAAREQLAQTEPTTKTGLIAFLDLAVAEQERLQIPLFDGEYETMCFIESLARSVRALAVQS
jgi:hypothetical protein